MVADAQRPANSAASPATIPNRANNTATTSYGVAAQRIHRKERRFGVDKQHSPCGKEKWCDKSVRGLPTGERCDGGFRLALTATSGLTVLPERRKVVYTTRPKGRVSTNKDTSTMEASDSFPERRQNVSIHQDDLWTKNSTSNISAIHGSFDAALHRIFIYVHG